MNVLLDSSVLVEAERARFDLAAWAESEPKVVLWICDAGVSEFLAGRPVKDAGQLNRFWHCYLDTVAQLPSLALSHAVCEEAGNRISAARAHGFTVGLGDALHAGAAALGGCVVATVDTDHFRHLGMACFNPLKEAASQARA